METKQVSRIPQEIKELINKDVKEIKVDSLESYHNLTRLYNELREIEKDIKNKADKEKAELIKKIAPYTRASKRIDTTIKHVKNSLESFYNKETDNGAKNALTNGAYNSDYVYFRSKPVVTIKSEEELKVWLIKNGYTDILDINITKLMGVYKEMTTEMPFIEVSTKATLTNKSIK